MKPEIGPELPEIGPEMMQRAPRAAGFGAGDYTPMNIHKARRARWSLVRKELHDSLGLCNWMGPWVASPLKERGYSGDDSLESRFYSLATGEKTGREELDLIGERIFVMHRALTIRGMGSMEMRARHDLTPPFSRNVPIPGCC
jgi:aldehyde:ferredoxin oxidoreductase